jgi:ribonuclease HI
VKGSVSPTAPVNDSAPLPLQQLLTRLELADRLADGAFSLTVIELAQLVEQPLKQLESKDGPWMWRDWLVSPEDTGRWRLHRREGGSGES